MQLHFIVIGKLKESYWREAEAEYLKRLQPFVKLTIHELKEQSFGEKDVPEHIKEKEAEKIQNTLEKIKGAYVIALEEQGAEYRSIEFSIRLEKWLQLSGTLVFIMGGPLGLARSVAEQANARVSLSRLTFTHQFARIIFLEQLYRSFMIQAGRTYHHE